MYDEFGGRDVCRKISTEFYSRVATDPVLRPFFGKSFTCAIEELSAFLIQFLGGPSHETQRRWWLSLHESHQRFHLTSKERDAWLRLMHQTLDALNIPASQKTAWKALFTRSSAYIIDQPDQTSIPQLAPHWDTQLLIDQTVAAIRRHDPAASQLIQHFRDKPAIFAGLLAQLIRSNQTLDFDTLTPQLAQIQHAHNRTLLHEAARAGNLDLVHHLLRLGADPNILHSFANENQANGAAVAQALIAAGADVNDQNNHQRTTPLHMAARQGLLEIAETLIHSGAHVNARDRKGDTPLRRALNCKRPQVAELLLKYNATL